MALAILSFQQREGPDFLFRIDIGGNPYYRYVIGGRERFQDQGFVQLAQRKFESPMQQLDEIFMGRSTIRIPARHFDREHRYVQLQSFRTPNRRGATFSDIIAVNGPFDTQSEEVALPFSKNKTMYQSTYSKKYPDPSRAYSAPFEYKESRLSSSMFLGALLSALPKALPIVANVLPAVTGILGGLKGKGGVGAQAGGAGGLMAQLGPMLNSIIGQAAENPEMVGNLANMLMGLLGGGQQAAAQSLSTAYPHRQAYSYESRKKAARNTARKSAPLTGKPAVQNTRPAPPLPATPNGFDWKQQLMQAGTQIAGQVGTHLVNKMAGSTPAVNPADLTGLLANLQSSGLMDGKINPQVIQTLMTFLSNHLGAQEDNRPPAAALNALQMSAERADYTYAQSLTAAQADGPVISLAAQMAALPDKALDFIPVSQVKLSFADMETIDLAGRRRTVFTKQADVGIPLRLETPKPISKAIVRYSLKQATDGKVAVRKLLRLNGLDTGAVPEPLAFSRQELTAVNPNETYLLCVRLIWKNRQGRRLGTSLTQAVYFMDEGYDFDYWEDAGTPIPLNDVGKYRGFWHKVWADTLDAGNQDIGIDGKYYYVLETGRRENARMETLTQFKPAHSTRINGKLKTGMILSPSSLAGLAAQLAEYPPLEEAEVRAMHAESFREQVSRVARFKTDVSGLAGDSVALWVYPEVQYKALYLKKVQATNQNGRVTQLGAHRVFVPVPVSIHYIGTKLEP